jgi:putative flippase GtrA
VGGIAALVEWLTFAIFIIFSHFAIATIFSFLIATFANYVVGLKLTFKKYEKRKKDLFSVYIVSGIGLLFNLGLMYIFVQILAILPIISKIISTGIVFFWNYISRRIFIYRKEL